MYMHTHNRSIIPQHAGEMRSKTQHFCELNATFHTDAMIRSQLAVLFMSRPFSVTRKRPPRDYTFLFSPSLSAFQAFAAVPLKITSQSGMTNSQCYTSPLSVLNSCLLLLELFKIPHYCWIASLTVLLSLYFGLQISQKR